MGCTGSTLIVGGTLNTKSAYYQIALIPALPRYFPSPYCENFQRLYEVFSEPRVLGWYQEQEDRVSIEDYYKKIIVASEEAVSNGRLPIPVIIATKVIGKTKEIKSDEHYRVMGYFGCKRFLPTSLHHTIGIYISKDKPIQLGTLVISLACAFLKASCGSKTLAPAAEAGSQEDAITNIWPPSVFFQTKTLNTPVYRILATLYVQYPDLFTSKALNQYNGRADAQRTNFICEDRERISHICLQLANSHSLGPKNNELVFDLLENFNVNPHDQPQGQPKVLWAELHGERSNPPASVPLPKEWEYITAKNKKNIHPQEKGVQGEMFGEGYIFAKDFTTLKAEEKADLEKKKKNQQESPEANLSSCTVRVGCAAKKNEKKEKPTTSIEVFNVQCQTENLKVVWKTFLSVCVETEAKRLLEAQKQQKEEQKEKDAQPALRALNHNAEHCQPKPSSASSSSSSCQPAESGRYSHNPYLS